MITIPAVWLLIGYGVILLALLIFMFAHVYHGFRFGKHDRVTMGVNMAFLLLTASIVTAAVILLLPIDWTESFTINAPSATIPSLDLPSSADNLPDLLPTVQ